MNSIRTHQDLLAEKKRLMAALVVQKSIINNDMTALREKFSPAISLLSVVGKIANQNSGNLLLASAFNIAGEIFLKNKLLSRAGKVTQLVVPFLFKRISSFIFNKNRSIAFQKLKERWKQPIDAMAINMDLKDE